MLLALGLLTLERVQPIAVEQARLRVIDTLAPVLDAMARPMTSIEGIVADARSYLDLRGENARLRTDNAQLAEWRNAVATLRNENRELRGLLNFKAEPGLAYISARVIADTGGPYERGLIVTAGKTDGVREGMAAMTGDGLIGRVIEAGDWSSRILLITDLNSRIPVTIADTGDRAILAGDNSAAPGLLFLPRDSAIAAGSRVVTSGHGGVFPPDLPVGTVEADAHGALTVVPSAELGRITYVRLVDFGLKGGAFNTVAGKIEADAKAKKH